MNKTYIFTTAYTIIIILLSGLASIFLTALFKWQFRGYAIITFFCMIIILQNIISFYEHLKLYTGGR